MKEMPLRLVCGSLLLSLTGGLLPASAMEKDRHGLWTTPPDLTAGGTRDASRDYNLGPTGAKGWMWTGRSGSRDARQILVTGVEEGSPASDKLKVGDVIVGAFGREFEDDVRKAFADAITQAETEEKDGLLHLGIWRDGRHEQVTLKLNVLGSYSATSPFDCQKTQAIIDSASEYLMQNFPNGGLAAHIAALGLLATGRDDVLPFVREYAHAISDPDEVLSLETIQSYTSWFWGYKALFLTEYYLRTNDEYVLPVIREYATKIAMGQSGVGTWGQAMCPKDINDGRLHGVLGGYGAMNQASLVCMMSLSLAEKCGVTNDEITQAIRRGDIFFSHFINKGAIPYGDHPPRVDRYDDNGKSGGAAVMFSLMGKNEGSEFFAAMALAEAPTGRESGHTGHFFNQLWGGLGPARGGKAAQVASYHELRWYYELERNWRGGFVYQGPPGIPATGGANNKYGGWDTTGSRLLQMSMPRQALYITGKAMNVPDPLSPSAVDAILAAGRLALNTDKLKTLDQEVIIQMLGNPLPPTREMAGQALAMQNINIVDQLITMLDSPRKNERYGATQALRHAGWKSSEAVEALVDKAINSDDLALQLYAIDALLGHDPEKGLAFAAKPAIPSLLRLAVRQSPDDPRGLIRDKLGSALCYSGRAQRYKGLLVLHGLDDIDRSLLIPAIRAMLAANNGQARSNVASIYTRPSSYGENLTNVSSFEDGRCWFLVAGCWFLCRPLRGLFRKPALWAIRMNQKPVTSSQKREAPPPERTASLVGLRRSFARLQPADLEQLWGDIYLAARDRAPSGVMFAEGVRGNGIRLMQKHGFKEGIDIAIKMLREDRWGRAGRLWHCLPVLEAYGGSARVAIPVLEELAAQADTQHARVAARRRGRGESFPEESADAMRFRKLINTIKNADEQNLRSIMPYVKEKR